MEGYIILNMDNGERPHNHIPEFNRTHSRHSIPIPGTNSLFGRDKCIQCCFIIYNYGRRAITYCASKGNSTTYEWIKQIIFGTINNTSNSNSGYGNYTNLSTNVTAGSTYTITFKPGLQSTAYREYWTVYIDYNQNGTLNNTGETVVQVSTTSGNGGTANITIPTTAKSGTTRNAHTNALW